VTESQLLGFARRGNTTNAGELSGIHAFRRTNKPTEAFRWTPRPRRFGQWHFVHDAEIDIIVEAGESAKSLNRPGMQRLLALIDSGEVQTVILAKLDRLTRSVKDLCELLERFERRGVALISVANSLDTGSATGRLVLNIMTAVSQWEREAIGERTRDALSHKRSNGDRQCWTRYASCAATGIPCGELRQR
jgi:DNA invertase Pin-like site-specific DNA recombinase